MGRDWATLVVFMSQVQRFFEASVLGMLLAGYLAVAGAGALSAPVLLLMLAAIGVRGAHVVGVGDLRLPSHWTGALALLCLGWFPVDWKYASGNFVDATTHLVCFLAVIKGLSSTTPRDYGYLRVIAGLELLAAAIYSVTPLFFACLAAFLLCGIASYVSGEVVRGIAPRQGLRVVMPASLNSPGMIAAVAQASSSASCGRSSDTP